MQKIFFTLNSNEIRSCCMSLHHCTLILVRCFFLSSKYIHSSVNPFCGAFSLPRSKSNVHCTCFPCFPPTSPNPVLCLVACGVEVPDQSPTGWGLCPTFQGGCTGCLLLLMSSGTKVSFGPPSSPGQQSESESRHLWVLAELPHPLPHLRTWLLYEDLYSTFCSYDCVCYLHIMILTTTAAWTCL